MSLVLKASFGRRTRVFLAGETVEAEIQVAKGSSSDPTESILAWASCQLVCLRSFTAQKCQLPVGQSDSTPHHADLARRTSLSTENDVDVNILALQPVILFCDLHIRSGESKSFFFRETLPSGDSIPPSFKGSAIRFQYRLVVSGQRLGSEIRTFRLPLRVLVLPGLSRSLTVDCSDHPTANGYANNGDDESGDDERLLLQRSADDQAVSDNAELMIEQMTATKGSSLFNVILDEKKVAKFRISKTTYKLGDEVIGQFDFADTDVKCVEYCVTLQSEEEIEEQLRLKGKSFKWTTSHTKTFSFCYSHLSSEVLLTIPLWVSHTFQTEFVKFRWRLHFEFVINSRPVQTELIAHNNGDRCWVAPREVEIKTLAWDLPIIILPCSPITAGLTLGKLEENDQINL